MMQVIRYPKPESWNELLTRPVFPTRSLDETVNTVLQRVRAEGDKALQIFTKQFDGVDIDMPEVSADEIAGAASLVSAELKEAMATASENIKKFHEAQMPATVKVETMPGVTCWQKPVPIEKVGLYIPGGTAPLFSTVLMLAIPAKIAECREIVLCTPPAKDGSVNPAILYAASVSGITRVFKAGGAQAIAAMAYGTESIPRVHKIFGPGNQYVTAAKQLVAREDVAIDMPAGPSEVAVIAGDNSNPEFIASDLLSQAEHGPDSQVILFTTSVKLIEKTIPALERQLGMLPRKELASRSLEYSKVFLIENEEILMNMVNQYAPEHLIINTENAEELAERITNAGSVFVGEYTPESAGDYASGTNHTLPTNGYARAYSGVNLDAYFKKITYQKISREGLELLGPAIEKMALAEELTAHQRAVAIRLREQS